MPSYCNLCNSLPQDVVAATDIGPFRILVFKTVLECVEQKHAGVCPSGPNSHMQHSFLRTSALDTKLQWMHGTATRL